MNIRDYIKNNKGDAILTLLITLMLIVLIIWSGFIIAEREAEAKMTPGDIVYVQNNEPEVTTNPYLYFDIPLDEDLQDHISNVCDEYKIDRTLIYAIIQRESNFNPDEIGDEGASYGLMQVQPYYHEDRMELFDCHDLLDPYQNVRVGIDYFAELLEMSDDDILWALMAYNGGPSYADEMTDAGYVSQYVEDVLNYKAELRTVCNE